MPYLVVDNFSAGLDSRRHVLNSKDGTLAVLKNAHITRGGEIEKRKAFSQFASLPENTFGLETTADNVYVFGSSPAPTMPAGVTYQRLQHPDGLAMTKVVWSTVYGGLPFVIAEYSDGKRYCFWDGSIIGDWFAGIARPMQSTTSFVSGLAAGFNLPGYTCVASGNKLTITGPVARQFTVTGTADWPLSLGIANEVETIQGTPEVLASAKFSISGYHNDNGASNTKIRAFQLGSIVPLPTVTGIYVDNENIMNASVNVNIGSPTYYSNPRNWFILIADSINAKPNGKFKAHVSYDITNTGVYDAWAQIVIWRLAGTNISDYYTTNGKVPYIEFESDPSAANGIDQIIDLTTLNALPSGRYRARTRKDPWGGISFASDYDSVYTPTAWVGIANPPSFSDPVVPGEFQGGFAYGITKVTVGGIEMLRGRFTPVVPLYLRTHSFSTHTSGNGVNCFIVDALVQNINAELDELPPDGFLTSLRVRAYVENEQFVLKALPGYGAIPNNKSVKFEIVMIDQNGPVNTTAYLQQSHIVPSYRPIEIADLDITPSQGTILGGVSGVTPISQVTSVTINGSLSAGTKVSITINDDLLTNPYVFGASRVADLQPSFSITYKAKEYAAVGSTMYFSALNNATKWGIYDLGSGFIDMSNNFGGRESLTGFGVYQNNLAVFSRRNVQLWYLDADPSQNQQRQILANTGCLAPDSVVSMGSIDLLYLADNGIRSLRARENTDTAFASDIGSPIDSIVIEHMATLTNAQIESARAIVEPLDGRYWLALGDKVFVLSYFPGSSISAWSMYEPGFSITDMAVKDDKVYARSGNSIYVYGGEDGATYDSCQVVVELPYMDGRKPATYKRCKGVDVTIQGEWKVYMGFDHTNPNARDLIATPNQPTFAMGKIDAVGIGTHFGLRMTSQSPGYARIANVIVHFDEMQAKHEAG